MIKKLIHGRQKVKVNGYTKHRWRCPKCGRAAPEDFCIVHGDVAAVDITKNAKIRKMALEYSIKTEKEKTKKTSLKKDALAYLKRHGYTGIISGEFLAKKEKLGVTLTELKESHLDLMIEADKETKAKEKERKRKDIIGKQDRARAKKKIAKKAKSTTGTKSQVKERQSRRTPRARAMDSKKRAKEVVGPDRYGLWLRHPNRYDIEGVDA